MWVAADGFLSLARSTVAVIMISSNEQHEMVEACIRAGADSYLFKPLRITDFSNIWQFVMQQRCHKLHAERREMRYLRNQQLARMKQIHTEKARAIALADAEREKAQRERAEADAARQRAAQEAELDRQREDMQKEIMRLLHHQVRKYWLLARMCNDVIVHASNSGFFLYLSPECKVALGYSPHGLSEASILKCVHPEDLEKIRLLCIIGSIAVDGRGASNDSTANNTSSRSRSRSNEGLVSLSAASPS